MSDADPPAVPPSRRRLSAGMLALAIGGFALPVVAIAVAYKACLGTTTVRGSVFVRGPGLAVDWRQTLDTCTADPTDLAVHLGNADGRQVYALLDPLDGPRLRIEVPAATMILTRADCPELHVHVRRVGRHDNGSQVLDGSASVSCKARGVQIDLDAWWRGCHRPDPE